MPSTRLVVTSPVSGRQIYVDGKTYQDLASQSLYMKAKLARLPRKRVTVRKSQSAGSSNAGKYLSVKDFCGPAGGSAKGTYPVNTPKRARAALSYARHAPRPAGVRACVRKTASKKGWLDAKGRIKVGSRSA